MYQPPQIDTKGQTIPALRFLQTGDLHLGKPFGRYPCADRLRVARAQVITHLIEAARTHQAPHVLVAGDLFETPNPAAQTWRQALQTMAEAEDLTWWLLPGNHDNLREGRATWEAIAATGHANLRVLFESKAVEMQPGAWLLPAPLMSRQPTSDPTAWMDAAQTPEDAIRIGLAHGSVTNFDEGALPADIIAPDRAAHARLDWLALGDWHGAVKVNARTAYAGAPERTGFQHDGRGSCLVVTFEAMRAKPEVQTVELGTFDWRRITLDLVPGDDPAALLADALPQGARRDMLIRLVARGRLPLRAATALEALEDSMGPDFCHFEIDLEALTTEIETADLDAISGGGALRSASDALAADATSDTLSEHDRKIAEAALRRLHTLLAQDPA